MPRLIPLVFAIGLLAPSAVAAETIQPNVDQWLTQRHASLTQVLDKALRVPSIDVSARQAPKTRFSSKVIRVGIKPMTPLSNTPNI